MTEPLHWIAAFRQSLGMSQESLAAMLNTSRSNIAMSERQERLLPNAAMLRLMQIKLLMDDPQVQASTPALELPAGYQEFLRHKWLAHAQEKQYEAALVLRKIEAYEKAAAQRDQMRLLVEAMTKHQEQYPPTRRQQEWLARMRQSRGLFYVAETNATAAWEINKLRYRMLMAEADEAEKMAMEIPLD